MCMRRQQRQGWPLGEMLQQQSRQWPLLSVDGGAVQYQWLLAGDIAVLLALQSLHQRTNARLTSIETMNLVTAAYTP